MPGVMDTLGNIRRGSALADLSDGLATLAQAVRATGKKGKLTLTIVMTPTAKGDGNIVTVTDDTKLKLPLPDKSASVFFVSNDGELLRDDPRQQKMDFAPVSPFPSAVKPAEAVNEQ